MLSASFSEDVYFAASKSLHFITRDWANFHSLTNINNRLERRIPLGVCMSLG